VVEATGDGIGEGTELLEPGIGRGMGAGHCLGGEGRATQAREAGAGKLSEGRAAG
jgi:hypothetical protein